MTYIPGYENRYSITKFGYVYSHIYKRFLKHGKQKNGYLTATLTNTEGKVKRCLVHRLVMLTYVGPSDLHVNHKDGKKQNNSLDNLEYCSIKENIQHSIKLGLTKQSGEDSCHTILTWDIVDKLRSEYVKNIITLDMLSKKYNINRHTIHDIVNYNTWKQGVK